MSRVWSPPPAAELSRRNSDGNGENVPLPQKAVVLLKKELAQTTEALNKALKRENELKVSGSRSAPGQNSERLCAYASPPPPALGLQIALTELESSLRELEGRNEGHAVTIESLTATLTTKDEIIAVGSPRDMKISSFFIGSAAPEFSFFWPLSRFSTSDLVREETAEPTIPKIRPLAPAWRQRFLGFPREREP